MTLLNKIKAIWSPVMEDKKPAPKKPRPWEVVSGITKNYSRKEQERILELLNQKLQPPNPYSAKGPRM